MADDKLTNEEALAELASLGRRITELANVFEAGRGGGAAVQPPTESKSPDAERAADRPPDDGAKRGGPVVPRGRSPVRVSPPRRPPGQAGRVAPAPRFAVGEPTAPSRPAAAAQANEDDRRGTPGGVSWLRRPWPATPMLVSIAVHVAALLLMALVFVPRERPPVRLSIVSLPADDQPPEDTADIAFEPIVAEAPPDAEASPVPMDAEVAEIDLAAAAVDDAAQAADQPLLGPDAPAGGFDAGSLLAAAGGGADGAGAGGDGATAGSENVGGGGLRGRFFGRKMAGQRVLFMCDNSASYADGGFQVVLLELSRVVALMTPEQSFHVVFFSDAAYPLLHPEGVDTFLPATPENKRRLDAWLPTVELCLGGRGIRGASKLATSLTPDVIYFLSDGDHADSVVERLVTLPLDGTVMHTFGIQADVRDRRTGLPDPDKIREQQRRNEILLRIAESHGGRFMQVTIGSQMAMAAAVRPVKKNRTRGTVWGTALPVTEP